MPAMSLLVPPVNFGMVSDGLYRSSEPTEINFPFLSSLHLRTILYLGHSAPSPALAYYVDDHNAFPTPHQPHTTLTLTHLTAQHHSHTPHHQHATTIASPAHALSTTPAAYPHSTPSSLTEHTVIAALSLLLSPPHLPCLICCPTGGHSVGVVVGCYRRVEGWSLQAIYSEYRRYAEEGGGMNEQFIELFDVELVGGRRGRGKGRGGGGGGGLLDDVGGGNERRRESESSL